MTLDDFRATGRDVPDLSLYHPVEEDTPGRVYLWDALYIEGAPGNWTLQLGRSEYRGDLPALESLLFDLADAEGFFQ